MKIVAVTACPTGIAHTYMAQEAIEKEAEKRGFECQVETQGGMGIENELEQETIDEADVVILAIAVEIEGHDRFDEKDRNGLVHSVDPGEAIRNPEQVLDDALALI
ncbi:PTS fructose transporter subunit IIB [Streptococcus pluranimalium]|uniref:PTS fructose transporter subunit IIBC n=1 Tax=Streptococcus pluranimalium TaxID=82348 RepID=A0A2L0D298_9STRE|nr:PTS fructose transporter subunit IIB [Streptococcus pluranimalium]AUW95945.1 PTS fructose transporter subunit IIBC [Streptococcus pluranimalium]